MTEGAKLKHLGMTIKPAGVVGGVLRFRVLNLCGGQDLFGSVAGAKEAIYQHRFEQQKGTRA